MSEIVCLDCNSSNVERLDTPTVGITGEYLEVQIEYICNDCDAVMHYDAFATKFQQSYELQSHGKKK